MKLRDPVKQSQVSLDLQDVTHEKGYIKFGPEHERITVQKYRDRVKTLIKTLKRKCDSLHN
ncbi:MAG: hypothetical protein IPN18_15790 [Ignavibacteriales bacterium]|nr:hypothetical protein [Ignavibacteriales bacterium]